MADEIESIKSVQEAEGRAKTLKDKAMRDKAEKLQEANDEAKRIVDQAMEKARAMKDKMLDEVSMELEKERKKGHEDAEKEAARIKKTKVTDKTLKKIVDEVVKSVFGA